MRQLPIIDISPASTNDSIQPIADQITEACASCGFFYLKGHALPPKLIIAIRQMQRQLFDQPDVLKQRISISQFNRGYLAQGEARMHGSNTTDQKEVFFWGAELDPQHPDILNKVALCGPNQWPDIDGFKETVLEYSEAIRAAGNTVLKAIALSLGAPADFFETYFHDSLLRGQLIRYPHTEGNAEHFGVAPHSDFGCITLLLQETPGLEVLIDDAWIAAPPIENSLVVNIGDLLERWSNRRLPSTRHRVRNLDKNARYSIAMFHDPAPTAYVDPRDLDPTIDAGLYEPVTAANYILGRNQGAFAHYQEDP